MGTSMPWFGRARPASPAGLPPAPTVEPPPADVGDDPATLRANLFALNRFVNQNSGELPGEAVVTARRIGDVLREIIETSEVRPLDIYAVVSVKGILNDYLPTTLR